MNLCRRPRPTSIVLREGRIVLATGEVVHFGSAASHRRRFEVVENAVPLPDDLDREGSLVVDLSAEPVAGLDVEAPPERRRNRDHPPIVDRGFPRERPLPYVAGQALV